MTKLTHLDVSGAAIMVDVGAKDETLRVAIAKGTIRMAPETLAAIEAGVTRKGDVLAVARVAGIMAAKRTPDLIPLCHPLPISSVTLDLVPTETRDGIDITATVKVTAKTGVEMEALTAVSVAALTLYDMVKAIDRQMVIGEVRLVHKEGGRSGITSPGKKDQIATKKTPMSGPEPRLSHSVPTEARDVLRAFMIRHGLKVSDWTKAAGVRSGELFSFLNGQSKSLAPDTAKRLAKAAGVTVKELFAG